MLLSRGKSTPRLPSRRPFFSAARLVFLLSVGLCPLDQFITRLAVSSVFACRGNRFVARSTLRSCVHDRYALYTAAQKYPRTFALAGFDRMQFNQKTIAEKIKDDLLLHRSLRCETKSHPCAISRCLRDVNFLRFFRGFQLSCVGCEI